MAFITFLARRKGIATYKLVGRTTVGRSLDCDIYIPDIFVSRRHCRFENRNDSWYIIDMESSNGIWHEGQRHKEYLLKPGDLIEIGTIAFRYNGGEAEEASQPAPYGMGLGVTELMDTVFTQDVRPSQYSKKQAVRKSQWLQRMQNRLATEQESHQYEPVIDSEPWNREDWAELDVETQIVAAQAQMTDWQPPIFNPKRAEGATAGARATTAKAAEPMRSASNHEHDSIDEEVEARTGAPAGGGLGAAAKTSAPVSWGGPSAPSKAPAQTPVSMDGVEFIPYTWRDRLVDTVRERSGRAIAYIKLNPAVAAGVALGAAVLVGALLKFSPVMPHSGPHIYVPETESIASSSTGKTAK